MNKLLWKLRSKLIKLLAGDDIIVGINLYIDKEKGFTFDDISHKYVVLKNMEISGFDTAITVEG